MADLDGPRWGPAASGPPSQLVILCHGVGADGHDLIDLAPRWGRALPHAAFISPDAPEPYDMAPFGRQWFSLADRAPARMEAGVRAASGQLDRFIAAELARLSLPAHAYALMGFSQGAMTSLFAGLRRDPPPRAILAFSGALLGATSLVAEMAHACPVLLAHGERDEVVPIDLARASERALRAAGVPVETVWSANLGHGIDEAGLTAGGLLLQKVFAAT